MYVCVLNLDDELSMLFYEMLCIQVWQDARRARVKQVQNCVLCLCCYWKHEMVFTDAQTVHGWYLNAWQNQCSSVWIEGHNRNLFMHCTATLKYANRHAEGESVPTGMLWLNWRLTWSKVSSRLEPRRRTDGSTCFMKDSEHVLIQTNLRKMLFKRFVCLQELCVNGLTCVSTQDLPVEKPMAWISFEHDCVSVLDIPLNPQ